MVGDSGTSPGWSSSGVLDMAALYPVRGRVEHGPTIDVGRDAIRVPSPAVPVEVESSGSNGLTPGEYAAAQARGVS
jgi:hypothetical protein